MPVSKYYFPDANLELTAKYNDNKSLTRGTRLHTHLPSKNPFFSLQNKV